MMSATSESTVTFSFILDANGNMKIKFDGSNKQEMAGKEETHTKLSPVSSLDITEDSEILVPGVRRRASSTSTESFITSDFDSFFEKDDLIVRSSTPLVCEDVDNLSDVSFTSCVSTISESSAITDSSQETVTTAAELGRSVNKETCILNHRTERNTSVSYEKTNKNRYGGWVEGDWRSAMKKPGEIKVEFSNTCKTPVQSKSPFINGRKCYDSDVRLTNNVKSRIPSLKSRPSYISPTTNRPLPSNRANILTGSYASVASHSPSHSAKVTHFPKPNDCNITMKMTLCMDSNGDMKIKFLNQASEEFWFVRGMTALNQEIEVLKIH